MRNGSIRLSLLSAAIGFSSLVLCAQSWDAASQARSWAKQDKDDSFTFYDSTAKTLHTWMREGGLMGSIPLGKVEGLPERWLVDPRGNAWILHGTTANQIDKAGHGVDSFRLPAEVGDVCWDAKGFVLSYRTPEPYLEKRDFKGSLLWSFGAKPPKNDGPAPQNRRPVLTDDAGNVLMADRNSLNLAILDGGTGKKIAETTLHLPDGQPAPLLEGVALDRGPTALWAGKGVVFAALKASQIPAAQRGSLQGLALARIEFAQSLLEFLPTGLDETHVLIGVLDSDAVFVNPKGGLLLVKIR